VITLLTALCALRLDDLKFDYDFEAFFPNENHELEFYHNYRTTFGHDNEFVLVAPENPRGIFRKDYLEKIDSLTRVIARMPDVRQVLSPTNLTALRLGGLVPFRAPVLHFRDPSRYPADSAAIYSDPTLRGSFFPEDARSVTIFVRNRTSLSKSASDQLATSIGSAVKSFGFADVHMVGRIFAQKVFLDTLQREFLMFLAMAVVIVLIFLWLTFRNAYGVIVPVIVVTVSAVWTLALMELTGKAVDLMTIMLPTMVFIAGSSDVVHFFSKYFEEQGKGTSHDRIFSMVIREVGVPTFITLITTAVGFLSLLFSTIRPVREFGIYTSAGITFAFILTYTLLPALLFFVKPARVPRIYTPGHGRNLLLQRLLVWILSHQRTILVASIVIIGAAVAGIARIRVNNELLGDLHNRVRLKQDFLFFDRHYSGVRPLELDITLKTPNDAWDYDALSALNRLDQAVDRVFQPGFHLSPAVLVSSVHRSTTGEAGFPDRASYEEISGYFTGNRNSRELKTLATPDGHRCRITAKIRDIGSAEVESRNRQVAEFIADSLGENEIEVKVTGAAHLIDRNNQYMVHNMLSGFIFSVVVTGLLTLALHRSWRMVLIFLLPNVMPAVLVAGIMGYFGIELEASTSLVFSIAFGIATDDTIHFISRLKIEKDKGKSLVYAFKRTFLETGRPVILTTFILTGGFISLMTSSFRSTYHFGLLICITLAVALIADLFVLPVLLFMLYPKKKDDVG
jgi:uncharacterized protein